MLIHEYCASALYALIKWFLEEPNIALGRPAYQSSNYSATSPAGLAVDGNRNGDWFAGSCTGTGFQTVASPWWAVDLGRQTSVLKVIISNRIDALRELSVVLYNVVRANRY